MSLRSNATRSAVSTLGLAVLLLISSPSAAGAHSALESSDPAPGARLGIAPQQLVLHFNEPLARRLTTAAIYSRGGRRVLANIGFPAALDIALKPASELPRGSYRVVWHSVSTEDGHELEGSFSFGVQVAAIGGAATTLTGPFDGLGWLRTLIRAALYPALFLFAAALLLRSMLGRKQAAWLLPSAVRELLGGERSAALAARERSLILDVGLLATMLAAASALLDTQSAAGSISPRAMDAFLLADTSGLARVGLVALLALSLGAFLIAPLCAGALATLALGALALAGHADSASPRGLAVAIDWAHLLAGALWLGGIAWIAWLWLGPLRGAGPALRRAVMVTLLPRFGRVALPAFLVVALTGVANTYIQLRHPSLLWDSSYGRVLLVKSALVAVIALVSYTHAFRLRPRLLAQQVGPPTTLERRHRRLLSAEPVLGVALAIVVAVLIAFPLPRQVAAAEALAQPGASCSPCALPLPKSNELSVATHAGSDIVAAWIKSGPRGLYGEVRVLDIDGQPASVPLRVDNAVGAAEACGSGCRAFAVRGEPKTLGVAVGRAGPTHRVYLPTQWQPRANALARRILNRAQTVMRQLKSVRQVEQVNSVPGLFAITDERLRSPDRAEQTTYVLRPPAPAQLEDQLIAIGLRQWTRAPGRSWRLQPSSNAMPLRTATWFTWSSHAEAVRLLGVQSFHGRRTATLALMDPGTPAWWTLHIELATGRVLDARLITSGHFISDRYSQFNRVAPILAPRGARP